MFIKINNRLKIIEMTRFLQHDGSTLGFFKDNNKLYFTLEPLWVANEKNISCIPDGIYEFQRNSRGVYEADFVKDRTNIQIHVGNTVADTQGCILLGLDIGRLNNKIAVLKSTQAFNRFMDENQDAFLLDIITIPA